MWTGLEVHDWPPLEDRTDVHEQQRRLARTRCGALLRERTSTGKWRFSPGSCLDCRDEQTVASGGRTPKTTDHFTEVVEPTEFQKGAFLDHQQQRGNVDEHVPPLHSQVFEPPNLSDEARSGRKTEAQ